MFLKNKLKDEKMKYLGRNYICKKININRFLDNKSFLNRKKLITVKEAQKQSVIRFFIKKKIPFREFRIKTVSEEVLGKLFSYFIISRLSLLTNISLEKIILV